MKRVHIIGRKNHGKTTLVTELVAEFRSRGWKVGTIKHTHHHHELDTPGKDSHRHREAGASVVGILARSMNAVFWANEDSAPQHDRYASFAPAFSNCDLVIVEGDVQTDALKLEVWRAVHDDPPMFEERADVAALITDDRPLDSAAVLARSDVASIADYIQRKLRLSPA